MSNHDDDDEVFNPTEGHTSPTLARPVLFEGEDTIQVGRCRLTVMQGKDTGKVVLSQDDELTIGAAAENHLVLSDATVSRHHCSITVTTRGFILRDLGSRNGTFVNGVKIETCYLQSGAELKLGTTTLHFDTRTEPVRQPISKETHFGEIVGQSAAMRRIFALLPRIAAADTSVLIEGETGTGKGLMAEALHAASPRGQRPFVVVDCGAVSPALFESELFGHERGAFTGAHTTRIGAFEAAHGGTLFIDEIGELPLDLQPKLLRALDRRRIVRVGATAPIDVDVRVIAATNRDLRQEVNRGRFRADLFYRLNTLHLRLPSLSERPEDLPLLIQHLYQERSGGKPASPGLVTRLAAREWPGNVRELRNTIERIIVLDESHTEGADLSMPRASTAGTPAPQADEAPVAVGEGVSFRAAKEEIVSKWERTYLKELLRRHRGVVSRAAREAKMDRNHLADLLRRYALDADGSDKED